MRDKVTRQCPQTTTFEEEGEQKRIRTEVLPLTSQPALPLGQTGSQTSDGMPSDPFPLAVVGNENLFIFILVIGEGIIRKDDDVELHVP